MRSAGNHIGNAARNEQPVTLIVGARWHKAADS